MHSINQTCRTKAPHTLAYKQRLMVRMFVLKNNGDVLFETVFIHFFIICSVRVYFFICLFILFFRVGGKFSVNMPIVRILFCSCLLPLGAMFGTFWKSFHSYTALSNVFFSVYWLSIIKKIHYFIIIIWKFIIIYYFRLLKKKNFEINFHNYYDSNVFLICTYIESFNRGVRNL